MITSVLAVVLSSHFYVVTTTQDYVPGSLRDAIEQVNADPVCGTTVLCSIAFATSGPESVTYAPLAPLPPIRKCNVLMAGADDLEFPLAVKPVAISGENVGYGNGLEVRASCGAGVPGVMISAIAVHSWPWNGIYFEAPAAHADSNFFGHSLSRVYVGTDASGLIAKPNRSRGIVTDSPYEVVSIANVIASGNGRSGIAFFRGKHARVTSSHLGTDRLERPLGNRAGGIFSFGVPFEAFGNLIAYNSFSGIAITPGTRKAAIYGNRIHTNGNVPIDWALDNRSRDDDDETDGILNAPRVLDAFYDANANLTRVRGIVRLKGGAFGEKFTVQMWVATTTRGDVQDFVAQSWQPIPSPPVGTMSNITFDLVIPGDFRGKLMALQTIAMETRESVPGATFPLVSSEISEALPIR